MLLDVDVRSPLSPEDLRSRLEANFPNFSFRSGTSGQQGGIYVSGSSVGDAKLHIKAWFYDDRPEQFSVSLSELAEGEEQTSGSGSAAAVTDSLRQLLEELGTVSNR